MCLIEVKNVDKVFGIKETKVEALKNINLKIDSGEFVAIVGASGSGKSTLLNIIGTLDKQTSGEYYLEAKDLKEYNSYQLSQLRNKYFGFVVQHFALINDYTVYENIEIPLEYGKVKRIQRIKLINEVVSKLDIKDKLYKRPTQLSGGQCQRTSIARAIVNNPHIILADEPTGALDKKTGQQVIDIFKSLNMEGKTIIIVTHDMSIASQCSRIIKIDDGMIIEDTLNSSDSFGSSRVV